MVRIVCEGVDDEGFLKSLLRHLEIKNSDYDFNQNIQSTKGKSILLQSETYKKNRLNQEVGKNVDKVLFVFDADFATDDNKCGGLKNSEECIEQLIKDLGS